MENNRRHGILLEGFQKIAHYHIADYYSTEIVESYPLPPYSTIIGFIHTICGWKSYHKMDIGVSGKVGSYSYEYMKGNVITDSRKVQEVKEYKVFKANNKKGYKVLSALLVNTELLLDTQLRIHILPENVEDLKTIEKALNQPKKYTVLGRHEDYFEINNVETVEIELKSVEEYEIIDKEFYIPLKYEDNQEVQLEWEMIDGVFYKINKEYQIREEKLSSDKINRRAFNKVDCLYVKELELEEGDIVYRDSKGNCVFLA